MRRAVVPKQPKPCPRCYAPMRPIGSHFECERHGRPQETTAPTVRKPTKPARQRTKQRPQRPREVHVPVQTRRLKERRNEIVQRNQAGESVATIAVDLWRDLGYADQYVCASKIGRFLKIEGTPVAAARTGPAPGSVSARRFSPERLHEVRAALADGSSVWAIAGERWEAWGFTNRSACDSLIRKWLRTKP